MRTRDWRRAQREKRMSAARNRLQRIVALCPQWYNDKRLEREKNWCLRHEGKNIHPITLYANDSKRYRFGNYKSTTDRTHEAMDYDLRGRAGEIDPLYEQRCDCDEWDDFLRDALLQSRLQFSAPLTFRLTGH